MTIPTTVLLTLATLALTILTLYALYRFWANTVWRSLKSAELIFELVDGSSIQGVPIKRTATTYFLGSCRLFSAQGEPAIMPGVVVVRRDRVVYIQAVTESTL